MLERVTTPWTSMELAAPFGSSRISIPPFETTDADTNRSPRIAYHGTTAELDRFDSAYSKSLGFHFGNRSQANFIARHRALFTGGTPRVIRAHLIIRRVLRMHDTGFTFPDVMLDFSPELQTLPHSERVRLRNGTLQDIQRALELMGYDGVVYANKTEEGRGDSWIVFHPYQIVRLGEDSFQHAGAEEDANG